MSDDRTKDTSGGGFDDWLDDEPGPVTDPYKTLASEESEEEIADWMAFADQGEEAGGTVADEASTEETPVDEPTPGDDTPMSDVNEEDEIPLDEGDETSEIDVVADGQIPVDQGDEPSDVVAMEGDDSVQDTGEDTTEIESEIEDEESPEEDVDHEDTGELEVVVPIDDALEPERPRDQDVLVDDDATNELEPVESVGFGDLWDEVEDDESTSASSQASSELFDISQEDYLHTATRDHVGLAEEIAVADDQDTEQVALAAPIPGLEATVVGFEDVVEAEGHGRVRARASGDLVARVITGAVLIIALGASLLWRPALVLLALTIFVLGAGEFYTSLVRSGRKPIALFGFLGIIGASLGAFFLSALWIPIAFAFAAALLLLFYAVVPGKDDPIGNLALTVTVMVWAGLGSFAMLIANSDSYRTLVFGVVVAVATMDIAQYFFGRALGRHQLAPWVSPKKTVEGLVAGVIVAMTVGALLHFLEPFELTSGLAIGAAVSVFAPMGDLAMSAAKRSLGLKDMGSVLPGHGGFLDRIDGLLFVIPVAWAIFVWAGIL